MTPDHEHNDHQPICESIRKLVDEGAVVSSRFSDHQPHMVLAAYGGGAADYYGVHFRQLERHASHLDARYGDIAAGDCIDWEDMMHLSGMARLLGQLEELERAALRRKECPNCGREALKDVADGKDSRELLMSVACQNCQYRYEEEMV